jgi:DNA-binding response OmpR family regulator
MSQQKRESAILVVERSPVARQSLSELFRSEGFQALEAADNITAIDRIMNNRKLNVILIDLDLPAWDSVIKKARANVPNAHILSMVSSRAVNDVAEAAKIGASRHFLKPLDFSYLHQSIQSLLADEPLRYSGLA